MLFVQFGRTPHTATLSKLYYLQLQIFWQMLQQVLKPTHITTHKGPTPGGHCCQFSLYFVFFSKPQTLNSNAFFCIQLQEFYKSEPTFLPHHTGPLGGTAAMFSPYVLFLFLNPKPYTSMHSFAFNFKILETNQNSHFFTPETCFPCLFGLFHKPKL